MTDHYAAANRLIDGLHNLDGHNAAFDMALAQVHATLALAEQQRLANLIALNEQWEGTGYPCLDIGSPMLRPDIARAIRIEPPCRTKYRSSCGKHIPRP